MRARDSNPYGVLTLRRVQAAEVYRSAHARTASHKKGPVKAGPFLLLSVRRGWRRRGDLNPRTMPAAWSVTSKVTAFDRTLPLLRTLLSFNLLNPTGTPLLSISHLGSF